MMQRANFYPILIRIVPLLLLTTLIVANFAWAAPPEQVPNSRTPVDWPFAWDSIWNMPIGDGAVYVPAGIQPATQFGVYTDEDLLILEPNAPLVDVIAHDADWDPNRTRCGSIVSPTQVLMRNVPVPADFSTDPGYEGQTPNQSAAILMPDGVTIRQTQPLHRCGSNGPVVSQYNFPDDNIKTGNGIPGAHGGSSMSSMGGAIRLGELVPGGTLRHALKLVIDSRQYTFYDGNDATPGYRWPARTADFGAENGYGGQVPELEMGALLALKPDFDVDSLRTEPAKIIARAMMDYGGYLVDSAGWDAYYFATEWGPNGRVLDEFEEEWGFPFLTPLLSTCSNTGNIQCRWSKDMTDIFTNLHVIDNNTAQSIGGPGVRRQPCAPPFNDGSGAAPEYCARSGNQPSDPVVNTPTPTTIPSTCAGNLITNPGFENGLQGWNDLGGSTIVGDSHSGAAAVRVGTGQGGFSRSITAVSGESFSFEAQAKVSGNVAWTGVGMAFYDTNGNRVGDFPIIVTSTAYETYRISGIAPAETVLLDVWGWTEGGGHLFADDFCVTRASDATSTPTSTDTAVPPTPTLTPTVTPTSLPTSTPIPTSTPTSLPPSETCAGNLLANPGFENSLQGWNDLGGSSVSSDEHSGSSAIRIGTGQGGFSQNFSVIPGELIHFEGWAKISGNIAWSGIGMAFYDADWNRLSDLPLTVTSTSYQRFQTSGVAPTGAAILDVWGWTEGGGHLFADDFCVTRANAATSTPTATSFTVPPTSTATPTHTPTTSDLSTPNREAARQVLNYLTTQSDNCAVISGQFIGNGEDALSGYTTYVTDLESRSGRAVGLVAADYYSWTGSQDYRSFNQRLIEHWNRGGLVSLSWHANNPWTGGDSWDISAADLNELLDENSARHAKWLEMLDGVADGLAHLRDEGVIVLWRPFHEMSGNWFWWGMTAHPDDPEPFRRLWRHMHDYLTQEKGIDNLLWVYAPARFEDSFSTRSVNFYYPGSQYVDIVGQSAYNDNLDGISYDALLALGKPIALTEVGPLNTRDGSYDNLHMLEQILNRYPRVVYWLSWSDWVENGNQQHLAIVSNQNATALMNHECVTTLDEIDLNNSGTPRPTSTPTSSLPPIAACRANLLTNADFEDGANAWNDLGGSIVVGDARNGSGAMRAGRSAGGFSQNFSVTAGEFFTLQGWAKISENTHWSGIGMAFFDADWNRLTASERQVTLNTYTEYTMSAEAPAQAAFIDVWGWTEGNGYLFADTLCLTKDFRAISAPTATPTSPNVTPTATSSPTPAIRLQLQPIAQTIPLNAKGVCTNLAIFGASNLGAFDFDLQFPANLLHVDQVMLASFLSSTGRTASAVGPDIDNSAGQLTYGAFSTGTNDGPDGNGVLAQICFSPQAEGNAKLVFTQGQLTDLLGNALAVNLLGGEVTISSCYWADVDCDSNVDIVDIQSVAGRWNTQAGDSLYTHAYDLDQDADIDILDVQMVAGTWGWSGQQLRAASIPRTANAAELTLSLIPSDLGLTPGQQAELQLQVTDATDLAALEVALSYDPTLLAVNRVTWTDFLGSTGRTIAPMGTEIDNQAGVAQFGAATIGENAGVSGQGVITTISVIALETGNGILDLYDSQAADGQGIVLPSVEMDGSLSVSGDTYLPIVR